MFELSSKAERKFNQLGYELLAETIDCFAGNNFKSVEKEHLYLQTEICHWGLQNIWYEDLEYFTLNEFWNKFINIITVDLKLIDFLLTSVEDQITIPYIYKSLTFYARLKWDYNSKIFSDKFPKISSLPLENSHTLNLLSVLAWG